MEALERNYTHIFKNPCPSCLCVTKAKWEIAITLLFLVLQETKESMGPRSIKVHKVIVYNISINYRCDFSFILLKINDILLSFLSSTEKKHKLCRCKETFMILLYNSVKGEAGPFLTTRHF